MTLADIKAEAARLNDVAKGLNAPLESRGEGDVYRSLEDTLQILKRKHDRGAISDEDYSKRKQELFEQLQDK